MTTSTYLLLIAVATHLPFFAVSMQTENGYLCNLCHSLENEYPYPPPSAELRIVRFSKAEDEQFGLPWNRGSTCLEIWNKVLDYANPNVDDETSCRSMASAYASQCCNDYIEEPPDNSNQQQVLSNEAANVADTADVNEISLTTPQLYGIIPRVSNDSAEKTKKTRPGTDRLSTSSMASGRDIDVFDKLTEAESQSLPVNNKSSGTRSSTDRLSSSTMGTGREADSNGDNDRNLRRTASAFYLRGRL